MVPQQVVYISTTGVYGDCAGAWVDETRPLNPNRRAWRRWTPSAPGATTPAATAPA